MSRVGKKVIELPKGVSVNFTAGSVKVVGPKGTLSRSIHESQKITEKAGEISVALADGFNPKIYGKFHGLTRTLVANMIHGVAVGYSRSLTLVGVGYRANASGNGVQLGLGLSHPVDFQPPAGIEVKVEKLTTLIVSGAEKELVGQVAAVLRGFRPPEPYHGKGIRYSDEVIVTKVGKAAGKAK